MVSFTHFQRLRDGGGNECRVTDRRQWHEPDTIRKFVCHALCDPCGKAGLAHATGTGESEEANVVSFEQGGNRCHFPLTADKGGKRERDARSMGSRQRAGHELPRHSAPVHSDQAIANSDDGCLATGRDVELTDDGPDVPGGGAGANEEGFGDLAVGPASNEEAQHIPLAR